MLVMHRSLYHLLVRPFLKVVQYNLQELLLITPTSYVVVLHPPSLSVVPRRLPSSSFIVARRPSFSVVVSVIAVVVVWMGPRYS